MVTGSICFFISAWYYVKDGSKILGIFLYMLGIVSCAVAFINYSYRELTYSITKFYIAIGIAVVIYLFYCQYTIKLFNVAFNNSKSRGYLFIVRTIILLLSCVAVFWLISFYGVFIYDNNIVPASDVYSIYSNSPLISISTFSSFCADIFTTGLQQLFSTTVVREWSIFCNSFSIVCCSFIIVTMINIIIKVFNIGKL